MKKALAITLVITILFSFGACTLKKGRVLITGYGDMGGTLSELPIEYYLQKKSKQIGDKNRTCSISIGGNVYTGKYVESLISPYYKCDTDNYEYRDDTGLSVVFWINRDTNDLTSYGIGYLRGYEPPNDGSETKSYEECRQAALNELALRTNPDDYVPYNIEKSLRPMAGVYHFYFIKQIGGADTNDIVSIRINSDGSVRGFSALESPSIDCSKDHSAAIEAYYSERSLELLAEKIRSIYSDYDQDKLTWEITDKYIIKLRSGRECVQFEILVYPEGGTKKDFIELLLSV